MWECTRSQTTSFFSDTSCQTSCFKSIKAFHCHSYLQLNPPRVFTMSDQTQFFPHPRRIVTGHSPSGASTVVKDTTIPCLPTSIKCNFAVLYETHQFPSSCDEPFVDPADSKTASLANDKGVVLRCVDFPPKTETLYHRTISLDFGILMSGQIDW